jgi:hypothetical protein
LAVSREGERAFDGSIVELRNEELRGEVPPTAGL